MDDLKIYEKLSDLLCKDMLGLADEEEQKELEALLAAYQVEGMDRDRIIARLQQENAFDGRRAYRKSRFRYHWYTNQQNVYQGIKKTLFLAGQRQKRLRRWGGWISAAASVAVLLVVAWWLQYEPEQIKNIPLATEMIHPGQSCAMVTLADGKQVPLENEVQEWKECDGTVLRSESGSLTYKTHSENTGKEVVYNTVTIPRGGEYRLELADGTRVWLNAETELKFPVNFSGSTRDVYLKGEAYFRVSRNVEQEFRVHTSLGTVKVLGTSFNVRDYADEQEVVTTLETGKVVYVSEELGKQVVLAPGTQVKEEKAGNIRMSPVDVVQYVGWREGKYVFENMTLKKIMQTLERWYDIEVVYVDPRVGQLHFSGDLERYESINVFLDLIGTGGDVRFRTEGKKILIDKK